MTTHCTKPTSKDPDLFILPKGSVKINVCQCTLLRMYSLLRINAREAYLVHCHISKLHICSQKDPATLCICRSADTKLGNGNTRLGFNLQN